MKTYVKKEILLIILESLFYDDSNEIEEANCISFYHFLLDTFERELLFEIPLEQDEDISLCHSIIELLSNFDLLDEDITFWSRKGISEYLKDYSGLTDEEFIISISKFREMYDSIKCDFLLGFK